MSVVESCADGYSQLAALQCSDPSFMQYRGFGYLHARLLLALQYEVTDLERQLDELDEWDRTDRAGDPTKLSCIDADNAEADPELIEDFPYRKTRPQIMRLLKGKLMEYGKCFAKRAHPKLTTESIDR